MHLGDLKQTDMIILIGIIIIFIIIMIISVIYIFKNKKKHSLFYHKYNRFLERCEKIFDISLEEKKISVKEPNKILYQNLKHNVKNFSIINSNCKDLKNVMNKKKKKRQKDLLFDLTSLQELPALIDLKEFKDSNNPKLLKNIFEVLLYHKKKINLDNLIIQCFTPINYYKVDKNIVYLYNSYLLIISTLKNDLIEPKLYDYDDLTVSLEAVKKGDFSILYQLKVISKENELLISKFIKAHKHNYNQINLIIDFLEAINLYGDCQSLKDAKIKHKHIEKVNENTFTKLLEMNTRRFLTWLRMVLQNLYHVELDLITDSDLGSYLIMPLAEQKTRIIVVKKQQDKISSTAIKKIEEISKIHYANETWLVTLSEFSKNAQSLCESLQIKIIGKEELQHIINKYNCNYYQGF